jgi:hypothetical protein
METSQILMAVVLLLLLVNVVLNIVVVSKIKKSEGYATAPQTLSQTSGASFTVTTNNNRIYFNLSDGNSLEVVKDVSGTAICSLMNSTNTLVSMRTPNLPGLLNNTVFNLILQNGALKLSVGKTILFLGYPPGNPYTSSLKVNTISTVLPGFPVMPGTTLSVR